jgi:hypothetical protein
MPARLPHSTTIERSARRRILCLWTACKHQTLTSFLARCWVCIALEDRKGKVGFPRAYKAHFVGYESSRTLEPTFKVIQVHPNGTYGKVRISKDIIFDDTIDFDTETVSPSDSDFNRGIDEQERIVARPVVMGSMCQHLCQS